MKIGRRFKILAFSGVISLVFLGFYFMKASGHLLPGPLTALSNGQSSGGFDSHAELESECGHCHTPIHCLQEDLCTNCHRDVAEERKEAEGLHGRLPASRCQACHTEHKGREAVITEFAFQNIDHRALANFSLVKHTKNYNGESFTCITCHIQATESRYIESTLDCIMCHQANNPAYMIGHLQAYGPNCTGCHDGEDRMRSFDHTQIYPLDGAHANLPCLECHIDQEFNREERFCEDCHPEPDVHAGAFGRDCIRCHSATAWIPAQLTRHDFQLTHGGKDSPVCLECHPDTYVAYNCTTCHEHDPMAMQQRHLELAIDDTKDCASCHPSGAAGEAEEIMRNRPEDKQPRGPRPSFEEPGTIKKTGKAPVKGKVSSQGQ